MPSEITQVFDITDVISVSRGEVMARLPWGSGAFGQGEESSKTAEKLDNTPISSYWAGVNAATRSLATLQGHAPSLLLDAPPTLGVGSGTQLALHGAEDAGVPGGLLGMRREHACVTTSIWGTPQEGEDR